MRDVRPHPGGEGPRSPAAAHAPDGHPVLTARFAVPAVPDVFVRRPRLVEPLAAGLHHPLTLVTGPAGAGKTLLVADWMGSLRPRTAAWLTVEQEDSAPGVFWAYVLHALRHHGIPPPPHIGSPADPGEVDRPLLARLADWLDHRDTPVVLVLDAFDRVAGCAEVAQELEFLLDHAGPALHLVITSRTEPLLPLHRHRAAGGLVDIRGADLAFRAEETAELTARHGLALSTGCADALTERTGGWAAGVRLCALAARQEEDPEGFLEHFEPGHSTVADFLLAEVLTAQPAETQDLLLRISILEETHPSLADALTGRDDAAPILADLHRANAFVAPLGHDWYRVHPLFAEILRVHLRTRHPGLEPELRRAAARWLRGAGLPDQALPHTTAAGDWEQAAAELVGRPAIGRLLTGLDAARLADLFAGMPPDVSGPAADLVRAARELARHDVHRGLDHLRRAEEALPDDGTRDAAAVQLSGALLRVFAARLAGSADMAEAAAKAAADARQGLPAECLDDSPELSALLLTELGTAQLWAGRFDAARAALSAAAEAPEGPLTAMPRHESLARLALVDLLHGRPGPAESRAREAVAGAERAGVPAAARSGTADLVLSAAALDRADLRTARTHLARAASPSAASRDAATTVELALLRCRVLLLEGDVRAARRALDGAAPAAADAPPWAVDRVAAVRAAVHLAEGDPASAARVFAGRGARAPESLVAEARAHLAAGGADRALRVLDRLTGARSLGPATAARVLLARAEVLDATGDPAGAERLVRKALSVARPHLLRGPFTEAGPWPRRFLAHRPELLRAHDWLVGRAGGGAPSAAAGEPDRAPAPEQLSARERDVLERLAQLMSTEDIAADLHLSVNTVKTHLKSVYRKLAATRRGEAVRRARELGLL
ncbi:helix-turn-helix transcriptional regulator [Streptomyces sp. CC53]|uniref:LuxR C-terminal-related transcriptional regulator n=1 Tax=unclassified Streptomyces TaxID=2593676 RepID=UPI0008DCA71C|nr:MULTISPECIES: LuxR C-terminal-related transcriptional regulator [unclassified Streptomyces]OII65780.1 helix-turn-helix transcriptional regulator [Streptomyces sp. CC53]